MQLTDNEQQKIILASGQLASVFEIVAGMSRSLNSNDDNDEIEQRFQNAAYRLADMFHNPTNADRLVDLFKNIYNRRDLSP